MSCIAYLSGPHVFPFLPCVPELILLALCIISSEPGSALGKGAILQVVFCKSPYSCSIN